MIIVDIGIGLIKWFFNMGLYSLIVVGWTF